MKILPRHLKSRKGIALIMVLIAVFVLSVLVGAFAYSMKVETRLAQNSNNDANLIWLGRSGVELARYVLAEQLTVNGEPYDSLNQKWAGGPGGIASSNSPLADISLDHFQVGNGTVTVKITDLERKVNVNTADEGMLQQALTSIGIDGGEAPAIADGILDWIDPDDSTRVNGAESDYYQGQDPPYFAKNGAIDDLSELLLIRGITQDMYWGPASTNHAPAAFQKDRFGRVIQTPVYTAGLVDIFTALSSGKINVNTASAAVLQTIPGIDQNVADQIIKQRSGPDGADGTEDDTPFANVGELAMAVSPQLMPQLQRYCDVRSRTFEVRVDAEIGGSKRTFYAIVGRNSTRDLPVLSFYWK
jgi:type II secretory pathway component PulK